MIKRSKILYLAPEVPFPLDTGGKVAFANHIITLSKNGDIDGVFLDSDSDRKKIPDQYLKYFYSYSIFPRKYKRAKGWFGNFSMIWYALIYSHPRAYYVRINQELKKYIDELIHTNNYDFIIVDHLTAYAFLSDAAKKLTTGRLIYISHNIESNVIKDQINFEKSSVRRFFLKLEYKKTLSIEKTLIANVDNVITISEGDYQYIKKNFRHKNVKNIPELLVINKKELWQSGVENRIIFIGSANYFPNLDAIKWIIEDLAPEINNISNSNIKIQIIGNNKKFLKEYSNENIPINIEFAGYIQDDEFDNIIKDCTLFISPVVYGSGIKIKVLKAISLGIPIFITEESMIGINFLVKYPNIIFNRKDSIKNISERLIELLNNQEVCSKLSKNLISDLKEQNTAIIESWNEVIYKNYSA